MANRIKELRQDRGLTQEQLADMIGTTKQQVGKLENGRIRLNDQWQTKLAVALQCHRAELLDDITVTRTPKEKAMLDLFRGLEGGQQAAFYAFARTLAKPDGSNDNGDPSIDDLVAGRATRKGA